MEPTVPKATTLSESRDLAAELYVHLSTVFIDTSAVEAEHEQLKKICADVALVVVDIDKLLRGQMGRTAARSGQ